MKDIEILHKFQSLEAKLKRVVMAFEDKQNKILALQLENHELKKKLQNKEKEVADLNKKVNEQIKSFKKSEKFTKIVSNNFKSTGNTAELKEKLNEYILEIDKCIDQLRN